MSGDQDTRGPRASFLDLSAVKLLDDWGDALRDTFPHAFTPLLVGSALDRPDFRDVDVRIVMSDHAVDAITELIDLARLNLMLSLWGQKVTGLPIDCQIQSQSTNQSETGRVNPIRSHRRPA